MVRAGRLGDQAYSALLEMIEHGPHTLVAGAGAVLRCIEKHAADYSQLLFDWYCDTLKILSSTLSCRVSRQFSLLRRNEATNAGRGAPEGP